MTQQIEHLELQLLVNEKKYQDTIHAMERKILQDKNQVKKEMIEKVNDVVMNFQKLSDRQMAEVVFLALPILKTGRPQNERFVKITQSANK